MEAGRFLLEAGMVSLIVFVFLASAGSISGFMTLEQDTSLSVANQTSITVSRFVLDQRITLGNSTPIEVELTNSGSNRIDPVSFRVQVFKNDTNTWEYFAEPTALDPGEFFQRRFKHTPQETGLFTVNLEMDVQGTTLQTSGLLLVEPRERESVAGGTITIVRRRVVFTDPDVEEDDDPASFAKSWRVGFPRNLTLSQGTTSTAAITVENTGNETLNDIRLLLQSPENISVDYNPKILFNVRPGETQNFLLGITAENDTMGRHDISFRLNSESFVREGDIRLRVEPSNTIERLRQEIRSLRLSIADAEAQARISRSRGYGVDEVSETINRSRSRLESAEEALDGGNLQQTQEHLDRSRESLQRAYQLLFTIRGEQVSVRAPIIQPIYVLVVASILLGVILVAAYYYMLQTRDRRPSLLREEEE